jgi:hypothetical protein
MSGTALDLRLVQDYLSELDASMRGLPAAQARELREQIVAHLDDALQADSDDQSVAATLRRLGSPADLAAEARAGIPAPRSESTSAAFRALLASVRPRIWIAACLLVVLIAGGARYADYYLSVGPLQYDQGGDWWFRQDISHQQIATTQTSTQNTTQIRSGQVQGYVISIFNPTKVTETIVGDASGPHGWNSPGSATEQLAVSRSYTDVGNGFAGQSVAAGIKFGLPVSIPPFASRLVRVLWTSDLCLGKGESNGIGTLSLRVRVGWFTRTEIIPQQGWYLLGPSHGRCV